MTGVEMGFWAAPVLWLVQLLLFRRRRAWLLALGLLLVAACCVAGLLSGSSLVFPMPVSDEAWRLSFDTQAQWLLGFGALVAIVAVMRGTPAPTTDAWRVGVVVSLLGALGVMGLQNAVGFLIAWELMSLGGALMLLGERLESGGGAFGVLFMLGLLEIGGVALMGAFVWLSSVAGSTDFSALSQVPASLSPLSRDLLGLLFLVGFGAKLGLLPFYEWLPGAYGSGSGATGTLLSGIILNAAFYALSRVLIDWIPASLPLSIIVIAMAVLSAIFAILYAFQEDDWRELLSLSTAENASLATVALGVAILFSAESKSDMAALAWVVAQIHLAGHCLAKGTLFMTADGIYRSGGDYRIAQRGWLRAGGMALGLGAIFAAMSLAAMPPQAGFVSEWYLFQSIFHGFGLYSMAGRVTLALAGAGVALTAAIAFATFIKVIGVGLMGHNGHESGWSDVFSARLVGLSGFAVLALGVGMVLWIQPLTLAAEQHFAGHPQISLSQGPLLVPLSAGFAFISPAKLVVAWAVMAVIPLALIGLAEHRYPARRAPTWFGGFSGEAARHATTALTYSNALRNFYSFIYRPRLETRHDRHPEQRYVLQRLSFDYQVAPLFGPVLFRPIMVLVQLLAAVVSRLQSGQMNLYLAFIGVLLVLILAASLF